MLYKECIISQEELFHVTEHGHYYVNPYYGCSEACPYCYWTSIPGWEGQITARTNVVSIFDQVMETWDKNKRICFGSFCNPYETIEGNYRLTRGLLEVAKKRGVFLALMTSSETVLDDAQLIASMKEQAVIVFELSRIERLVAFQKTGVHPVLDAANRLVDMGITVMATLSPYLKGITDLEMILAHLDPRIPIYLGEIDFKTNPSTSHRVLEAIKKNKAENLAHCLWLMEGNHAKTEFDDLMEKYRDNAQVRAFPLDIQYDNCLGGV